MARLLTVGFCGFGAAHGAEGLRSGPQVGATISGSFHALVVVSPERPDPAGKKVDFIELYGARPVILVFVRNVDKSVTGLLKKLDAEVARNKDRKVSALAVVLKDDDDLEKKLKDLAETNAIRNVSLAIDNPAGPKHYNLDREAAVTVILYEKRNVKANHAFKEGELTEKAIDIVITDVARLLGK